MNRSESRPGEARTEPASLDAGARLLLPLTAAVFLCFLTIGMSLAVVPAFVHQSLGFGNVIVGLTIGLQSLATVLTRRYAGRMADERGPKLSHQRGLAFAALSGAALLAATWVRGAPAAQLSVLLVGRLLLGVAESLLVTGTLAWAIARLGPAQSGRVMAWTGAAIFSGLAAGAPIGVWLDGVGGFRAMAAAIVLLPLLGLLVSSRVAGTPPAATSATPPPYREVIRLVWRQGIILALHGVGFAAIGAFVVLHFDAQGWSRAGLALSAFGGAFVFMRVLFGWLPDRHGGRIVALGSLAVEMAGLVLLARGSSPAMAFAGATLAGCGSSLVFPAMGLEVVKRVPASIRGTSLGTYAAFVDVAYLLTGPLTGAIATPFGYGAVFLTGAAAAGLAIVLLLAAFRDEASA